MKNMIACLLVVALTGCSMWADPGPDQAHADAVKKKVGHCLDHRRRVVFETYDNRRFQGFITEVGADDFVVSYAGQKTTLFHRDVWKIKWQSPVVRQIEIAAGAAAMTGALFGLVVLLGGLRGEGWPEVRVIASVSFLAVKRRRLRLAVAFFPLPVSSSS